MNYSSIVIVTINSIVISPDSKGCIRVQEHRSEYNLLTETIENFLNQSAYNQVCLPELFSWMVKAN